MPVSGKNVMELVIAARDHTKGAFAKVGAQMRSTKGQTAGLNTGMKGLKGTMGNLSGAAGKLTSALGPLGIAGVALAAGAAVGLFAASAVKSFTAFEDSMANVRKTTGMTKEATSALGASIDEMALRLPVAHGELAKIAAIAGQLGIQGEESILGFTEDIAKMSTAFDMSAESAATAMAKMANIYDIPIENVSALGSAINVLGNTTAAQESAIMDFSMALGASANQLGFCETEAVAMGATLISMGMDASASGTRLNAAFTQMAKNLDKVSSFLGISEDKFRVAFGEDPMAMITQIVTKLAQIEDPLERAATGAEMFGLIGAKSINALGGDLEGLQTNLANAAKGFEENTSLTEEFAAKTDTLKAQFALVGNAAESLKINIGAALAPLAGALAESAVNAISNMSAGFDALQKVVGAIHGVFKAFFDSVQSAVSGALKPLTDMLSGSAEKFNILNPLLKVFSDILVIVTAGAKTLGTVVGNLLTAALTPFIAKIQEGIVILTNFYDKLGPIKGLIEGVKEKFGDVEEGISKWADSLKESEAPADKLAKTLERIAERGEKVGPALEESFKAVVSETEEAAEAQKEFAVTIGDTTITFKGMAAEVVKNADAYKDLEDNAKALLDLDWSVFTDLEAELPAIDAGITDMSDAFGGLRDVLAENITELDTVKESVMDISEIAAPFLEAGFLDGIKSIGNFAGALSDAGAAINTFGDIQEINIEGCKNFSHNVRDMVTALEILENQIGNLVPSFERMGELTTAIAKGFIGDTNYINETGKAAKYLGEMFEDIQGNKYWDIDPFGHTTYQSIAKLTKYMGATDEQAQALISHLGPDLQREIVKLGQESSNSSEFIKKLNKSSLIMGLRLDINAAKLKLQTGQLVKITDALEPYLNFMRTLNELAALTAVSTEDLNSGFEAIEKTLNSLSLALSTPALMNIFKWIEDFSVEWSDYITTLKESLSTFEDATAIFSSLAGSVSSLNEAFLSLKDTTIITERDMSKAIQNIDVFINRFVKALRLNFDSLVDSLVDLDIEWSRHAEEMEKIMPSYKHASSSIGTLIGSLTSLSSALKELSEMGTISSTTFDTGFTALIESIGNFATSLRKNVDPLIISLQKLRLAWVENEGVLVPLMIDLITIARSFTSVAANVNNMVVAFDTLSKNTGSLEKGFNTLIKFIDQVKEATKKFYTPASARAIRQYIIDIAGVIEAFRILGERLEDATGVVKREVERSVNAVAAKIGSLKTLIPNMYRYGAAGIFAFAKGISDYAYVLQSVLQGIANMIKSYLGVSSPTELGALRKINEWPKNLVRSFSEGIKSEMGTLNASFSGMSLSMPGGAGGGGNKTTNVVFNVMQKITDRATADYSTRELERMLNRHEIM